jgi:hypothetical protein
MGPDDFDQQFQQTQHTGHVIFTLFFVFFGLIVVIGIVATVWRIRAARSLARSAGLDEGAATMAALSDENAMSTMMVATRLGNPPAGHDPDPATRLRLLDDLKAQNLITDAEYAEKRAAILDGL